MIAGCSIKLTTPPRLSATLNIFTFSNPRREAPSPPFTTHEIIPPNLANVLVTPETFANANAYLALTVEGQRRWDRGWQEFRAG